MQSVALHPFMTRQPTKMSKQTYLVQFFKSPTNDAVLSTSVKASQAPEEFGEESTKKTDEVLNQNGKISSGG